MARCIEVEVTTTSVVLCEDRAVGSGPPLVLLGFHGYGENAEIQLRRLRALDLQDVLLVCPQALHAFYTKRGQVGYCWMTSEGRERHIEANMTYVRRVLASLDERYQKAPVLCAGFSQGVATAFRAASLLGGCPVAGLGGSLAEDCLEAQVLPRDVLWGRGQKDQLQSLVGWQHSASAMEQKSIDVQRLEPDGDHFCWETPEWLEVCRRFVSNGRCSLR